MVRLISLLAVLGLAAVCYFKRSREWLLEEIKAASDAAVVFFLRSTSRFGDELTRDGREEQRLWREQRLRNLRGLALSSRQRFTRKERQD